jgi:hypothetical protein
MELQQGGTGSINTHKKSSTFILETRSAMSIRQTEGSWYGGTSASQFRI